MLRVRRRILSAHWGSDGSQRVNHLSEFPPAQFLHIDLDVNQTTEQGVRTELDPLAEVVRLPDEDRLCEPLDIGAYSDNDRDLYSYPLLEAWLPLTSAKIRELQIDPSKGAGQIRAIGRLYFFDTYNKIRDSLRSKLLALKRAQSKWDEFDRLGLTPGGDKLRIVVICSVAGGMGSGAFLDLGFLAKSVASEVYRSTGTDLMLMLPSGYSARNKQRIEANGYAALMELETCMRGDFQFVDGWTETESRQIPSRPFDDVYLIDSGNIAGQHSADQKDVYEMVADVLFEDFGTGDYASLKRSAVVNQNQFKIPPYEPTVPRQYGEMRLPFYAGYSAFGHAVLDVRHLRVMPTPDDSSVAESSSTKVEGDRDPLLLALEQMGPAARQLKFAELLTRAMPWVYADLDGLFKVKPDQCVIFVGVGKSKDFEKFKGELVSQVPVMGSVSGSQIRLVDTGIKGRAVCYAELSGIPLTLLSGLESWRASYRNGQEWGHLPVHTHKDLTRFLHPIAPSLQELKQLAEDFQIYLKAVGSGVLFRRDRRWQRSPSGQYQFEAEQGDFRGLGNERAFRLNGLPNTYRTRIIEAVETRLANLSPQQCAALAALFEHYALFTYCAKNLADHGGKETPRQSFASTMATILAQKFKSEATRKGVSPEELEAWVATALRSLPTWTDEIDGSETDAYPWEVEEPEDGSPRMKRGVKPDFFSESWTIPGLRPAAASENSAAVVQPPGQAPPQAVPPAIAAPGTMPPPLALPTLQFWLSVNGQNYGPFPVPTLQAMIATNQFAAASMVWREGMASWAPALAVPELAALFLPRSPAGPGVPPPVGGGTPPPLPW
jgi:hypothetical protein